MHIARDATYPYLQGDVLSLENLGGAPSEAFKGYQLWVVITQSCTIIHSGCTRVELMPCSLEGDDAFYGMHKDGKHPRVMCLNDGEKRIAFHHLERRWVDKDQLLTARKSFSLSEENIKKLTLWIARSYIRIEVPDPLADIARNILIEPLMRFAVKKEAMVHGVYMDVFITKIGEQGGAEKNWKEELMGDEQYVVEPIIVLDASNCSQNDAARLFGELPEALKKPINEGQISILPTLICLPDDIEYGRILKSHRLDYKDYLSQFEGVQ